MITGCAVTRGNSEDPAGKEQGDVSKRQERGRREKRTEHRKGSGTM